MIVAGSLRQLPYSLKVEGRQTYIVGYAFTPTGVEEPTVGNDWYPLDLDVYDNQEYASVDAYIASEEGQATLQGCGVSGLVPLATATQRLADNGINITVHNRQGAYRRFLSENVGVLVDSDGKCVIWRVPADADYVVPTTATANQFTLSPKSETSSTAVIAAWGEGTLIATEPGAGVTIQISGTTYTITSAEGGLITLSPTPTNW